MPQTVPYLSMPLSKLYRTFQCPHHGAGARPLHVRRKVPPRVRVAGNKLAALCRDASGGGGGGSGGGGAKGVRTHAWHIRARAAMAMGSCAFATPVGDRLDPAHNLSDGSPRNKSAQCLLVRPLFTRVEAAAWPRLPHRQRCQAQGCVLQLEVADVAIQPNHHRADLGIDVAWHETMPHPQCKQDKGEGDDIGGGGEGRGEQG